MTNLSGGEDVLDRNGDFGANAITLDEAHQVVTLIARCVSIYPNDNLMLALIC
jgi:hypothetical protein